MITTQNKFEAIPAFEVLASGLWGTWTRRGITAELIKVLETVQSTVECTEYWKELAQCSDDQHENMYELQEEIVEELNELATLPPYCTVELVHNEWIVQPYVDEELPIVTVVPDEYIGEMGLLHTNNYGDVTLYTWCEYQGEYVKQWSMV